MLKLNIPNIDLAKLKNLKKEDILQYKVLLIGIVIALFSLWYGVNKIYGPTMKAIKQTKMDVSQEGVNADILRRLALLQGKTEACKGVFAKGADMPWLVDKITNAANESRFNIISLDSRPLVRLKQFLYSSANVTAKGTFNELGDFISKIESYDKFIRVEKLVFTKEKDKNTLEAKMVISTYFLK